MRTVKFKFMDPALTADEKLILMPKRQSALASGFDLASSCRDSLILQPLERCLVPTGIAIALSAGFEAQVRSRSGLSNNNGVVVLNSPGTIDADYRGEIKVILINLSNQPFTITFGMRIAQLIIAPIVLPEFLEVSSIDESARGEAGFGSTGLSY